MIEVDISNIWTCMTLPELLGREKDIFRAHEQMRSDQTEGADLFAWLEQPDHVVGRKIHGIRRRGEQICSNADVLVVCGCGHAYNGARAAIACYCGSARNLTAKPQVLFVGETLSGRQWLEMGRILEDRDFCLHVISDDGQSLSSQITLRGLRWMMERKYGGQAKERISVATVVGTPLHKMAQEEGYELFPMPTQLGGKHSCLTAAALIPMTAAGIDPLSVLEGAVECREITDVRSFDNPAWLYAAARTVLFSKGRCRELFCIWDPALTALGHWWQRCVWDHEGRDGAGICPETVLLPADLDVLDTAMCRGGGNTFETMIRFAPIAKKIPVEMDWKDYDGLGILSGRHWDYVQLQCEAAVVESHNGAGVPVLDIYAGELTAQSLGQLLCFLELSSLLAAGARGMAPFSQECRQTRQAALRNMADQSL